MLTPEKAVKYEIASTVGLTFVLFLFTMVVGTLFTWLLWIWSVATVAICFIDYRVVGWKNLSADVQMRRLAANAVGFITAVIILRILAYFLIPDIDFLKIMSIISGLQRLMKTYTYMGILLHFFVYNLIHFCILNFIRVWVNLGYSVYIAADSVLNPA